MTIAERIQSITESIRQLEIQYSRPQGAVQLLAVSKGRSISAIQETIHAGLRDFAESYLQEAKEKIIALAQYPLRWHFIGPIQSNKTESIAQLFDWVHSVSRLTIAQKLNSARPQHLPPLNVCLQVKLDKNPNKHGINPESLLELTSVVMRLSRLRLRGLMVIAPDGISSEECYAVFNKTKQLMHDLNQQLPVNLDTLSMGMSNDMTEAIQAGSTIVRIGRGIYS